MILDSGTRRTFASGAVRDQKEGVGRCDLLPLDVVADLTGSLVLTYVAEGNYRLAVQAFLAERKWDSSTAMLEVSVHFEEGSKKYPPDDSGTPNWQKGIPASSYIDSAVRHYLKWRRGDEDERHDRAFLWNILCLMWTLKREEEKRDDSQQERV